MKDWIAFLDRTELFAGLGSRDRSMLLESAREVPLACGQALFEARSPAEHFHLLVRGAVKLYYFGASGRGLLLDFSGPGEVLGEDAVLLGADYDYSAVSMDRGRALCLPGSNLLRLLEQQPRLGPALAAHSFLRLRSYRERLLQMNEAGAAARLCLALHRLARTFGRRGPRGTTITLRLTHQDLAEHIGVVRETVTVALSRLKKRGLVATNGRQLIVPDLKSLKQYAD